MRLPWPQRGSFRLPPRWRWPSDAPSRRRRRRSLAGLGALLLLFSLWLCRGPDARVHWPNPDILAAIRWVESGDRENVRDGDDGLAIGPYQIHEVYWRDAVRADPSLGGTYQDCRRRDYAERVVIAYMRHHAAHAWASGDAETIARIHNGGPRGAEKDSTRGYWSRVRSRLP